MHREWFICLIWEFRIEGILDVVELGFYEQYQKSRITAAM